MCDPNELKASLKTCVDACFDHEDTASLYDCMAKCRTTKTETEAKCDNQKGKNLCSLRL